MSSSIRSVAPSKASQESPGPRYAPGEAVSDPFVSDLFGGSPRTATSASATSTGGTTAPQSRGARRTSLSVPATRSSCEQPMETPPSCGAERSTAATIRKASNARSFGTRVRTYRRSLSDRQTASLITAGLVCGITPSSTRKLSGAKVAVLAFDTPGGAIAAEPPATSSSLNGRGP
jgi:hypothetical protein